MVVRETRHLIGCRPSAAFGLRLAVKVSWQLYVGLRWSCEHSKVCFCYLRKLHSLCFCQILWRKVLYGCFCYISLLPFLYCVCESTVEDYRVCKLVLHL